MNVSVRFCRLDEIGDVMAFLNQYWSLGHVLSWHQPLVDWQHREPDLRGYSYVLARDEDGGDILGILGFISTRHYDVSLVARNVVDLAIWKIRDDVRVAGLGLRMHRFLLDNEPHEAVVSIGIGNRAHDSMYKALGYFTADYQQHYLVNPQCRDFRLARFPAIPPVQVSHGAVVLMRLDRETLLKECALLDLGDRAGVLPVKTPTYFLNRYLNHPVYDYMVHALHLGGKICGLMASRLATNDGASALRIVDFLGTNQLLAESGPALVALIEELEVEYADLWSWGMDDKAFQDAGFHLLDPDGEIVIPNYFEPFEQANGRIFFAAKSSPGERFMLYRGDGDQDRPNRIVTGGGE